MHVKCLPKDLPEHITIDVSKLELGQAIHVEDIKIANVEITNDPKIAVVSVAHKKVQADEPAAAATPVSAEPELVGGKGKKEEAK